MPVQFTNEADGLNLNRVNAFSNTLSAAAAGSTHFLLRRGIYTIWSDQPFAFFITNAANDPPAVPATQTVDDFGWPGALVNSGQILQFEMDPNTSILFTGVPFFPTGFRAFRLGAAGTFYLSKFLRVSL